MKTFVHESADFDDLLRVTAGAQAQSLAIVEKDYWVTHTLWALQACGLRIWFKGGTSLSKGFGLIRRFSEDLDLKIDSPLGDPLPLVSNWKSEGSRATREREVFFRAVVDRIRVPGASVSLDEIQDRTWRSANVRVQYPGRHLHALSSSMKPFVLLELGNARVTPFVERALTSFVHEQLVSTDLLDEFVDNRPALVRCVHPLVTLIKKLDALQKRVPNDAVDAAAFVRHFEDAARIIESAAQLPPLTDYEGAADLAAEMKAQKQIARVPAPDDPAFLLEDGLRMNEIRSAYEAISPMFWGPRLELPEACNSIRAWLTRLLC